MLHTVEELAFYSQVTELEQKSLTTHGVKCLAIVYEASKDTLILTNILLEAGIQSKYVVRCLGFFAESQLVDWVWTT